VFNKVVKSEDTYNAAKWHGMSFSSSDEQKFINHETGTKIKEEPPHSSRSINLPPTTVGVANVHNWTLIKSPESLHGFHELSH
jgi:hypothetical protein